MRLAQVSDFHYTHLTYNPLRLLCKRFLAQANWMLFRKDHFFEKQLDSLPELFEELGVDKVLLGGDFSTTALFEEFDKAENLVKKIKKPWYAIPGNHDCYTRKSCKEKHFYRYFSNPKERIAKPIDFFTLKKHRVEAHFLKEGWHLVLLDTALATNPYSSTGLFSERLENYLNEVLALIPENHSIVLLNHYPFFQNDEKRRSLQRGEALQKILEKNPRIRLYLHGHTHRHIVADLQPSNLPIVLDSGSAALGKNGFWNLIDLEKEGCKVTSYQWNDRWQKIRVEEFQWKR